MIQSATRRILSGKPIEIQEPVPDFLADEGVAAWYMAQPDPELYDDGQMVYQAKRLLSLEHPDVAALAQLPPTAQWREEQEAYIARIQAEIDTLLDKRNKAAEEWVATHEEGVEPPQTIGLTPEDAYHLQSLLGWKEGAEETLRSSNRATELVNKRAADARSAYMMPWLIVDKAGDPLFNLETEAGRQRWSKIGIARRSALRGYFNEVLLLVLMAKN